MHPTHTCNNPCSTTCFFGHGHGHGLAFPLSECCVVRACASHTRVACTCCACPAVRACAVRLRAGRVVRLCSVRLDRAAFVTSPTSRGCTGPCFVLALCMPALSCLCPPCSRCVYLLYMRLLCMLALCALALPMLALRAPAVRARAVRARAVRFRAVCGVLVQRSPTSCGAC